MQRKTKKLVLSKETLRDLTDEQMKVAAGGAELTPVIRTLPLKECIAKQSISLCCTPVIW